MCCTGEPVARPRSISICKHFKYDNLMHFGADLDCKMKPPLIHDQVAQRYDRARPGYPAALFDDIINYAGLAADARILEIGCGTGQATLPLAQRGYAIDCLEPGTQMAAIARANLANFPGVKVHGADFERFSHPPASYDLLLSATAFHWVDPKIRFRKAHDLLKSRAALALFWHRPVQTEASRDFVDAVQHIYNSVAPELTSDYVSPPHPDQVTTEYEDLIPASGYFAELEIQKHYVARTYSASAYVDLLATFPTTKRWKRPSDSCSCPQLNG